MANTTFSGAVRSENNFKLISKAASTGVVADQTVGGGLKDARRYQLSEYFNKLPALNAYLQASETKDWGNIADGDEEAEDVTETAEAQGLRPRFETPLESIPGGIKSRFGLKSQRLSEISRSIDAYTSQVTVAISESEDDEDDEDERRADSTPITIELQSH